MEADQSILELKKHLRHEVAAFCRNDRRVWKRPVVQTLQEIRQLGVEAVFFGGTLRSLLTSRLNQNRLGRPRDVDIVVRGTSIESLRANFARIVSRETRFGGLQLRHQNWQFDVWPLDTTWAFVRDKIKQPPFDALPSTTFFNMEAIAVEVWPEPGKARKIYSGDEQFFRGMLSRTLEINREENPFPELCVIRALVMATDLDFYIGPKLAEYIANHGLLVSPTTIDAVQRKHYGCLRRESFLIQKWIELTVEWCVGSRDLPLQLPLPKQSIFWPEDTASMNIRVHAVSKS